MSAPKLSPDLLTVYKRLRAKQKSLNLLLTKRLSREAMLEGGQALGLVRNGIFVFDTEEESSVLMDYLIHSYIWEGKSVVERYVSENPPRSASDEDLLLNAMLAARYSLFSIERIEPGLGAWTRDLLRGSQGLIVDVGLSKSVERNAVFAAHLLSPVPEFSMSSGAALPVHRDSLKILIDAFGSQFRETFEQIETLPAKERSRFTAFIIRTLLNSGASQYIRYHDVPNTLSRMPGADAAATKKPGRNEPCPCGSGKKYKKCCGR